MPQKPSFDDDSLSLGVITQPRSNPLYSIASRPHFSTFSTRENEKSWEKLPQDKTKRMLCQK